MSDPSAASNEPEEDECRKPCDPALNRGCCADYWARMEREGFWDSERHRWTDKGWKEITKWL